MPPQSAPPSLTTTFRVGRFSSVSFGINHDSDPAINPDFSRYQHANCGDATLANAYVLTRESGTPLIPSKGNLAVNYLPAGVKFRATMKSRQAEGKNARETVLAIGDINNLPIMERSSEGLFVVNRAFSQIDQWLFWDTNPFL